MFNYTELEYAGERYFMFARALEMQEYSGGR